MFYKEIKIFDMFASLDLHLLPSYHQSLLKHSLLKQTIMANTLVD